MKSPGILNKKEDGTFEYQIINEWQLCPKCNGFGGWNRYDYNDFIKKGGTTAPTENSLHWVKCDLCNGKMIISNVNGQPPE